MSLIDRFLTGSYEVRRRKTGTYVDGFYVAGEEETIYVRGSLQPTNARELKIPEEGARLFQYYNFFSDLPILTINTKSLAKADQVVINGETYKVWSNETWSGVDLPYHLAVLYREPSQ